MLADRAGLRRSDVNAIEHGRVTLPGADKRRKLADALGIRHVDILVAAGELSEDEVPKEGEPRDLFDKGTWQHVACNYLRQMDDDKAKIVAGYAEFVLSQKPSDLPVIVRGSRSGDPIAR